MWDAFQLSLDTGGKCSEADTARVHSVYLARLFCAQKESFINVDAPITAVTVNIKVVLPGVNSPSVSPAVVSSLPVFIT